MKLTGVLQKEIFSVKIYKYILSLLLSGVMASFILIQSKAFGLYEDRLAAVIAFSLIYLLAMLIISRLKEIELMPFLFISAGVAAAIAARLDMLPFVSLDYYNFILEWLKSMSELPFSNALRVQIGDYNLPYLYFLAILSRFSSSVWLVIVKAFSCVFDVMIAYYVMKIVEFKIKNTKTNALVFVLTLVLPTVLFNSACWAQCDSIYTGFCVASLYYAFSKKGTASMVMFGLAFAFKLQAVFIIPILLVCFILKYINWYKLIICPIVYMACMFPAVLCGRGLKESWFIYFRQASQTQYNRLTLNATSIWSLMPEASYDWFKWVGIMLAGLCAVVLIYLFVVYSDRVEVSDLVIGSYLSAVLLPLLLPSMHDRYFFIADVLSVCVFFFDTKKWYVPFVTVLASFVTYTNFLLLVSPEQDLKLFTVALIIVTIIVVKDFATTLSRKKPVRTKQMYKLSNDVV